MHLSMEAPAPAQPQELHSRRRLKPCFAGSGSPWAWGCALGSSKTSHKRSVWV